MLTRRPNWTPPYVLIILSAYLIGKQHRRGTVRHHHRGRWISALFVVALVCASVPQVYAANYTFSILASAGESIDGKQLTSIAFPSLNNKGDVVFGANVSGPPIGSRPPGGIFIKPFSTPSSLVAGTGETIGGKTLTSVSSPSLNDTGAVAFLAGFSDGSQSVILASPPGSTQFNPLLPPYMSNGHFDFFDVASGQWFDPPITSAIHYTIDTPALFTKIDDFPTGFSTPFTVSSGGNILGSFGPGSSFTFPGAGVSEFTISGITPSVDLANGDAFPLQLDFSQPTATFHMDPVPEPATWRLLTSGCVGLLGLRRWQSCVRQG